jgi:hypothetical protein
VPPVWAPQSGETSALRQCMIDLVKGAPSGLPSFWLSDAKDTCLAAKHSGMFDPQVGSILCHLTALHCKVLLVDTQDAHRCAGAPYTDAERKEGLGHMQLRTHCTPDPVQGYGYTHSCARDWSQPTKCAGVCHPLFARCFHSAPAASSRITKGYDTQGL